LRFLKHPTAESVGRHHLSEPDDGTILRILFVHKHCPGQFAHLARAFAARPENEVVFVAERIDETVPGARIETIEASRRSAPPTHHYVQSFENAVLLGQAAYRKFKNLHRAGFTPDLAYAHAGFGPGLYVKDAFPRTPLIGHFEWYYRARNSDADFIAPDDVTDDEALRIRTRNAPLLLELAQCDKGISPTRFQRAQFPPEFLEKLTVVHEGIDTEWFRPARDRPRAIEGVPPGALVGEIVTYAARGLEPYRGFAQFLEAFSLLQARRPRAHAIVLGDDNVYYGRPREDGLNWRAAAVAALPALDTSRVHFLGKVPLERYRQVLQLSNAHVYLTVPFVLSWSLIEAMATGCTIVGSDTAPVREVLAHERTGLLADFHDPSAIAGAIERALQERQLAASLGANARRHAIETFALDRTLARHGALAASSQRPLRSRLPAVA
jgi:glycosyltransferase involved in cell wall biosynthesis